MSRILITGGAGFIGSNLGAILVSEGYEVVALDDLSLGVADNIAGGVTLRVGDVARRATWDSVPQVEAIVHLAGASSAPMFASDIVDCFRNNILGFLEALEFAWRKQVRKIVYASTSSIYGNAAPPLSEDGPIDIPNFYAASKFGMEQIARMYYAQYDMEVVGLRFMSVYGPRERHKGRYANLVSQFIWDIKAGRAPTVYGDGNQTRDFTNVRDICQAVQRVINHPRHLSGTIFNVGTGHPTPVNELVDLLGELMGSSVRPRHVPNPVKVGYVLEQVADISRIRSVLGYCPSVTLRDGVAEILAHLDSQALVSADETTAMTAAA